VRELELIVREESVRGCLAVYSQASFGDDEGALTVCSLPMGSTELYDDAASIETWYQIRPGVSHISSQARVEMSLFKGDWCCSRQRLWSHFFGSTCSVSSLVGVSKDPSGNSR
jgi:hypothetical protein